MSYIATTVKIAADTTATITIISAWLGVLSTTLTIIATLGAIVWWGIRLYETDTIKKWLKKE